MAIRMPAPWCLHIAHTDKNGLVGLNAAEAYCQMCKGYPKLVHELEWRHDIHKLECLCWEFESESGGRRDSGKN